MKNKKPIGMVMISKQRQPAGGITIKHFPSSCNANSWKEGALKADISHLRRKAADGDEDAKARLKMLDNITARIR